MNLAILLAAGSGNRMQGAVTDKVLTKVVGKAVLQYSLEAFAESSVIDHTCIVCRDDPQKREIESILSESDTPITELSYCFGGKERSDSVMNALQAAPSGCSYVFIHDAARPLVSSASIQKLEIAVRKDQAAVLAHQVTDTIKRIPEANTLSKLSFEDLDRKRLWAMETPQAFAYEPIFTAYQRITTEGLAITDDCAAASIAGLGITIVENDLPNPKLTTAADLDYLNWLLQR